MEFPFNVQEALPGRVTIVESIDFNASIKIYSIDPDCRLELESTGKSWIYHLSANVPWDSVLKRKKEVLSAVIDKIGLNSAQAQNLRTPITSLKKLLSSQDQKIYLLRDSNNDKSVIGFLKVGLKRLFLCDEIGAYHELESLCILDFYIHESKQRCGFGHELFDFMLQNEKTTAGKLAIDRPSFRFLSFLAKHYGLENPITQSNNFVIYPGFFNNREVTKPPIFLYRGKGLQPESCFNKKKKGHSFGSYTSEVAALNTVGISLNSSELKKNRTFYSPASKCLGWNDGSPNSDNQSRRKSAPHIVPPNIRNHCISEPHSSVQSCSTTHKNFERCGSSSLTPINTVSRYSQSRWEEMQSSWSIFGVKPPVYQ